MNEIRVHGRGGQGAVIATEMLARAFVQEGKYATGFPIYTFERRGAPVATFLRVNDKPIRLRSKVYSPNCLVVIDPYLTYRKFIFDGIKPDTLLVWNTGHSDVEQYHPNIATIGYVDALKIGMEEVGRPITNTCMLGAFARTTGWLKLESILDSLKEQFSGQMLERNLHCVTRGFEETTIKIFRQEGEP